MKKLILGMIGYLMALIAVAVLNSVVLLQFHPLAYYYTWRGVLLSGLVSTAEQAVLWPANIRFVNDFFVPNWKRIFRANKEL